MRDVLHHTKEYLAALAHHARANKYVTAVWPVSIRSKRLIVLGLLYIILGFAYMPGEQIDSVRDSLRTVRTIVPIGLFAAAFMAVGFFALGAGLLRRAKKLAFMLLAYVSASWAAMYFVESRFPFMLGEAPRGITTTLLYSVLTVLVISCAGSGEAR